MRIGGLIIFHLSKLWKVKFFILCDVILISGEAEEEIWNWSLMVWVTHWCRNRQHSAWQIRPRNWGKNLVAFPAWRWCLSKVWSQSCKCYEVLVARANMVVAFATALVVASSPANQRRKERNEFLKLFCRHSGRLSSWTCAVCPLMSWCPATKPSNDFRWENSLIKRLVSKFWHLKPKIKRYGQLLKTRE